MFGLISKKKLTKLLNDIEVYNKQDEVAHSSDFKAYKFGYNEGMGKVLNKIRKEYKLGE